MEEITFANGGTGKFIRFLKYDDLESGVMKLANSFLDVYGHRIPLDVNLILPNGEIYNGKYSSTEKSISDLDALFDKYARNGRLVLVVAYKGSENFLVNVMNDGRSEIIYDNRRMLLNEDDILNGIGSKFYSVLICENVKDGNVSIDVPKTYLKRFESKLPSKLTLEVNTGEVIDISLMKSERRMYGMVPLYQRKFISNFDILLFTYRGDGKFDLSIFGELGIEKKIELPVTINDSDSDTIHGPSGIALQVADEQDELDDRFFDVIACASHVDGRSHGMYIPKEVKPKNREWMAGEKVILRTEASDYSVSLVTNGATPRFSSGWNQFFRGIGLKRNDTLYFGLIQDDEDGVIFSVEIIP